MEMSYKEYIDAHGSHYLVACLHDGQTSDQMIQKRNVKPYVDSTAEMPDARHVANCVLSTRYVDVRNLLVCSHDSENLRVLVSQDSAANAGKDARDVAILDLVVRCADGVDAKCYSAKPYTFD